MPRYGDILSPLLVILHPTSLFSVDSWFIEIQYEEHVVQMRTGMAGYRNNGSACKRRSLYNRAAFLTS